MKAHIVFTAHKLQDNLKYIRKIAAVVQENGGTILLDGYEAANARLSKSTVSKDDLDWDGLVRTQLRALNEADLIIIEGSVYNFSNGFWSALSFMNHKPTLFLYRYGPKQFPDIDAMFVSGLMSDTFLARTYQTEGELEETVSDFIRDHYTPTKNISLSIDQHVDSYLDKIARKSGKQKSEIIKDILIHEVHKDKGTSV